MIRVNIQFLTVQQQHSGNWDFNNLSSWSEIKFPVLEFLVVETLVLIVIKHLLRYPVEVFPRQEVFDGQGQHFFFTTKIQEFRKDTLPL